MTTERSAERLNRPWTAVEVESTTEEPARPDVATEASASEGASATDVQGAIKEAREDLRSEGQQRARELREEAERRMPAPRKSSAERPVLDARAIVVTMAVSLVAVVIAALIWSRVSAKPKSREEEIIERSREALDRSRDALDALIARLPNAASL